MPITADQLKATAEQRRKYLGGSDMPSLASLDFGCSLRLYFEKSGIAPDIPFFGSSATDRGNRFEALAAEKYSEDTGRQLRRAPRRSHPDNPRFACSSDYEIIGHPKGAAPLSIKVPGREGFFRMKNQDAPSLGYIAQIQWEMFIWNRSWGSFAIYWADGDRVKVWDIDRDDEIIKKLVEIADTFWAAVDSQTPPPKLDPSDRRCQGCGYRLRCHAQHLEDLLNADITEKPVDMPSLVQIVRDIKELQVLAEEADTILEDAKTRLRTELGDNQIVETPGFRIYNRVQEGRKSFDREAFKVAHPKWVDEVEKYTKKGKPFRTLRIYERP